MASQTVLRASTGGKPNAAPGGDDNNLDPDSLVEKLKNHYRTAPKGHKAKRFSIIMFHFQAWTGLYMLFNYILPHLLEDYSDMTRYYFKILFGYIFAMCQANWFCSVFYKSDLPDIRDKPTLDDDDWFQRPAGALKNAEVIEPKIDKNGFEWKYCKPCDRYKPPRSHHCDICKKCILRRDHHCYFIGKCVGHYNQRYFVVLCFLGVFTSLIGFPITFLYLITLPDPTSWLCYFLPYTLLHFFYYGTLSWQFTLLVFQFYVQIFIFIAGFIYFTVQISLISEGKTLVELAKKFEMKVTSSWRDHMSMVFGDYWFINFFFPAQIIFKQRHDGIHFENVKFFGGKDEEKQ